MWFRLHTLFALAHFLLLFASPVRAVEPEDTELANLDINKIFSVVQGQQDAATCAPWMDRLSKWYKESVQLINAAVDCFEIARGDVQITNQGYDMVGVAKVHTKAFFGLDDGSDRSDWNSVEQWIRQVATWLKATDPDANHPDGSKPTLFCDSTWLEWKDRLDPALGEDGQLLFEIVGEDEYARLDYVETQDANAEYMLNPDGSPNGKEAYWAAHRKRYYFGSGPYEAHYCDILGGALKGGTIMVPSPPYFMFLCAETLQDNKRDYTPTTLGELTPLEDKLLKYFIPVSGTLFHESFHLVITEEPTPDATYDWDVFAEGMMSPNHVPEFEQISGVDETEGVAELQPNTRGETNLQLLRRNPETFLFFAVAYWTWSRNVYSDAIGDFRARLTSGKVEIVRPSEEFA
ncbi:hypothetical protein SLS58_005969 [Diplodia intermedia]|uniref:Uncharacterized protein n=1 Tax=Diplodia intermedia TaxID=856260 RepID=A0ABR3TPH1_9PEZI